MNSFVIVLRISAPILVAVGCLHLVMGLRADVLLGANLPAAVILDPVLDSQNRFYGVAFTLFGVLLLVCSADVFRYSPILRAMFWTFCAAGAARLVSVGVCGLPTPVVLILLTFEIVAPLAMNRWLLSLEQLGVTES